MTPWCYFVCLIALCGIVAESGRKQSQNRYEELEEFDAVAVTRCDVICQKFTASEKEKCHERCLSAERSKLGACPRSFDRISIFAQACVEVCQHDSECPATEKCCSHSCGVTCQPATDLDQYAGLPQVPLNVSARELRGPSVVQIQWMMPSANNINKGVLFLVESRRHFGPFFSAENLEPWTPFIQATNTSVITRGMVLTAHWYIFRVAAVNVNGTRGLSDPSDPFTLSKQPNKPGKPKRLGVTKIREINGTIWGELKWKKPRSDVPIKRYKVIWSRRLPGHRPNNASDNIIVHHEMIPKNKHSFQLQNLQKDDLYYIQVQALANYGREKLRSKKAELFFNTTSLNDQFSETHKMRHLSRH